MKEKLIYMHKIFGKGVPVMQMAIILDIQVHPFLINFLQNFIKILFPNITLHAKLLGRMKLDYDGELSSCQLSQMLEIK
jgi:hypothetical protein